MQMKKPYRVYFMEKRIPMMDGKPGALIKGTRIRVKGEIRREEYENIGYSVIRFVEVV